MDHRSLRIAAVVFAASLWAMPLAAECGARSSYVDNAVLDRAERCELESWAIASGTSALVVSIGEQTIFELSGERARSPIHVMSVTKSVASLAIGRMLRDEQLASLDLPLSELFPEWRQGQKQAITLRHLLTHSTGIQDVPNAGLEIEPAPDVVQLALAAELTEAPGERFRYNNKASNLLATVVERRTGQKLDDYLRQGVLRELGIDEVDWLRDASGNPYVMAGLSLEATDLLRVGRLMNAGGTWQGKQLIDPTYAAEALDAQRDDNTRVGLMWWRVEGEPAGYQANGWLGQWLVGFPALDVVAVRLVDRRDAVEQGGNEGFLHLIRRVVGVPTTR